MGEQFHVGESQTDMKSVRLGLLAVPLLLLTAACGDETIVPAGSSGTPEASGSPPSGSPPRESGKRGLESLDLTLDPDSSTVRAGENLKVKLTTENYTDKTVKDKACYLNNYSIGLIPADEPDTVPWSSVITDCGGPSFLEPGYSETRTMVFRATDMYGDPLEPGDYLAAIVFEKAADPEPAPVTVTD